MTPVKKSALGQRPANQFEKKMVGIVDVTVGEKKAKFELVKEDGKEQKLFANGKPTLVVALEDLPDFPKLTQAHTGKQFRIQMNNDGDEVEALTPVSGHYTAKLIDLGPTKKDEEPTPYEKPDHFPGKEESSHLEFFAVYKITRGNFKGVQMPGYYLHYKFEEDDDGTARYAGNLENRKATRLLQLKAWMETHKLEEEPIKWDDVTILPVLLERALENDVEVDLIVKDGYIREVMPVQDDEPFEEPKKRTEKELKAELGFEKDEVEEEFPPKKAAKKPAKPVVEEEDEEEDL